MNEWQRKLSMDTRTQKSCKQTWLPAETFPCHHDRIWHLNESDDIMVPGVTMRHAYSTTVTLKAMHCI